MRRRLHTMLAPGCNLSAEFQFVVEVAGVLLEERFRFLVYVLPVVVEVFIGVLRYFIVDHKNIYAVIIYIQFALFVRLGLGQIAQIVDKNTIVNILREYQE